MQRLMEKDGIDLLILRGNENSSYVSEFFNNGGQLAYRPFTVFFFRDPAIESAFVVPAVDLHLAMIPLDSRRARLCHGRILHRPRHALLPDFFEAAKAVLSDRKVKGLVIGTEGEVLPADTRRSSTICWRAIVSSMPARSWSSAAW